MCQPLLARTLSFCIVAFHPNTLTLLSESRNLIKLLANPLSSFFLLSRPRRRQQASPTVPALEFTEYVIPPIPGINGSLFSAQRPASRIRDAHFLPLISPFCHSFPEMSSKRYALARNLHTYCTLFAHSAHHLNAICTHIARTLHTI